MQFDFKDSIKSSLANFSLLGVSKVLVQLLHLLILALIARKLGTESFGKFSVFLMVAQFIFLITIKWTATGFTRFSITHMTENKPISHIFWGRNLIGCALLTVIVLVVIFKKGAVSSYIGLPQSSIALLFCYYAALLVTDYSYQIAEITTAFKFLSIVQVAEKALLLILLWLFANHIYSIIYLTITAIGISRVWLFFPFIKRLVHPVETRRKDCEALLRFSLPLLFVSLGGFIFGWVDIAVIKHYMAMENVGIYSLAYNGLNAVESVALLMATVLRPIFISLVANKKNDYIAAFGQRILPQIQLIWGFALVVLGWLSTWLIPLVFGQDFTSSSPVFNILLISLNFTVFNTVVQAIFIGMNRVNTVAKISVSASFLNLILDFVLIPILGIMGAAVSTLVCCFWISVWYYKALNRILSLKILSSGLIVLTVGLQSILLAMTSAWALQVAFSAFALIICFMISKKMALFKTSDKTVYAKLALPGKVGSLLGWLCDYYEKPFGQGT